MRGPVTGFFQGAQNPGGKGIIILAGSSCRKSGKVMELMRARFFILMFFFSGSLSAAADYPSTDVDMVLHKVSQHAYFVQGEAGVATDNEGFISNAGVVITSKGIVIFDSLGTPSLAYKLLGRIREISDQPIVKVIISHYHADHIYGLQVFKDQGAEIWAPEGAADYLSSPNAAARLDERRISLYPWVNEDTLQTEVSDHSNQK